MDDMLFDTDADREAFDLERFDTFDALGQAIEDMIDSWAADFDLEDN